RPWVNRRSHASWPLVRDTTYLASHLAGLLKDLARSTPRARRGPDRLHRPARRGPGRAGRPGTHRDARDPLSRPSPRLTRPLTPPPPPPAPARPRRRRAPESPAPPGPPPPRAAS